jgi:hypothetical protein
MFFVLRFEESLSFRGRRIKGRREKKEFEVCVMRDRVGGCDDEKMYRYREMRKRACGLFGFLR